MQKRVYLGNSKIERFPQNFLPPGYLHSLLAIFPKNRVPAFGGHFEFLHKMQNK